MVRKTVEGSLNQQQQTKQELAQPEARALSAPWQDKQSLQPQDNGKTDPSAPTAHPAQYWLLQQRPKHTKAPALKLDNRRTGAIDWPLTNAAPWKQAPLQQQQRFVWKQSKEVSITRWSIFLGRLFTPQKWGEISKPLSLLKSSPLPYQAFAYDCAAWTSATQSTFYLGHKNSNLRSTYSYLGNSVFFQNFYDSNDISSLLCCSED